MVFICCEKNYRNNNKINLEQIIEDSSFSGKLTHQPRQKLKDTDAGRSNTPNVLATK